MQLRTETESPLEILHVFPQHSYASTMLMQKNGVKRIRKICPKIHQNKLLNQAHWYRTTAHLKHIPKLIEFGDTDSSAYLDLQYIQGSQSLFAYLHGVPATPQRNPLERIVQFVENEIFPLHEPGEMGSVGPQQVEYYLQTKIQNKILEAIALHNPTGHLLGEHDWVVNGETLQTPLTLLRMILNNPSLLKTISDFKPVFLHGDLTVENVLTFHETFFLIDPNDENLLMDPTVDFAKLMQSLDSGYEFFQRANLQWRSPTEITIEVPISQTYFHLRSLLEDHVQKKYGDRGLLRLKLHQAVHFARMLPYKSKYDLHSFWLGYFELCRCLNHFWRMSQ